MNSSHWFTIGREIPPRARRVFTFLSFVLPLVAWALVSYVPWLWHPLVRITTPGDVAWFKEGLLVERAVFTEENAKVVTTTPPGRVADGVRANPILLPAPHQVARAFWTAFTTKPILHGDLWLHESLWLSIKTIFWGFVISSALGVPLGILCGAYAPISRLSEPAIDFVRYMPAPAFGALAVAVLGIYEAPKIAIIVVGTFFQQVLVIANTVRRHDPALIEAAQTLGARRPQLLFRVIVPSCVVDLYNDQRILLGWAWTYLIVAEVVGISSGITFFINQQAKYRNFDNVYAAILIIGLIGLVTDQALAFVGERLFIWKNPRPSRVRNFFVRLFARREAILVPEPAFVAAVMSTSAAPLILPDYREQSPAVAERFLQLKKRPVVLEVDRLGRQFTTNGATCTALRDITFRVHRREFVCVIGPSGCGKSTLIRLVAGLETPTSGRLLLDGHEVRGPGPDRGMVFQSYTLFPWLTVTRNVMFGLEMKGLTSIQAESEALQWIDLVGLGRFKHAYPAQLSGGMKQRTAIARALAAQPRILLMDEPFGALDAQTRCQMQTHLLEIWRNVDVTILFITHDLDEAILLADRILVLKANPGEVQELIEVPVPRPRNPAQLSSAEFLATRRRLDELIHPQIEGPAEKLPIVRLTAVGDDVE